MTKKQIIVLIIAALFIVALPFGLWHGLLVVTGSVNESHAWYGFWSGFAGDLTIFAAVVMWYRKHNCHDHRCLRIGKHSVAGGHYLVCHKHYKYVTGLSPDQVISAQHIKKKHLEHAARGVR